MAAENTSSASANTGTDWGALAQGIASTAVQVGDIYMQRESLKHQQKLAKIEGRSVRDLAALRQQRANIALQQAETGMAAAKANYMPLLILGGIGMMGMMMIMMMKK